jgi:hypothetical protein
MIHIMSRGNYKIPDLTYVKTDKLPSGTTVDILQLTLALFVTPKINTGCMLIKKIT